MRCFGTDIIFPGKAWMRDFDPLEQRRHLLSRPFLASAQLESKVLYLDRWYIFQFDAVEVGEKR